MATQRQELDEARNRKLSWGALVLLASTVGAELLVPLHPHFEVDSWFAFAAWFGFGCCILLIVLAKALAWLLKRPDTYYADRGGRDD